MKKKRQSSRKRLAEQDLRQVVWLLLVLAYSYEQKKRVDFGMRRRLAAVVQKFRGDLEDADKIARASRLADRVIAIYEDVLSRRAENSGDKLRTAVWRWGFDDSWAARLDVSKIKKSAHKQTWGAIGSAEEAIGGFVGVGKRQFHNHRMAHAEHRKKGKRPPLAFGVQPTTKKLRKFVKELLAEHEDYLRPPTPIRKLVLKKTKPLG